MGKDTLTEEEAALYDRQIRLWGVESQNCLREADILIAGLTGLAAEVIKNLTLSGVKSITIVDKTKVQVTDFASNFFLAGCELGQNRAAASKSAIQQLNSNVKVNIDDADISSKSPEFYSKFNAVCLFDCPLKEAVKINKTCRAKSVHFYSANSWGFYGYCFVDLLQYSYKERRISVAPDQRPFHMAGFEQKTEEIVHDYYPLEKVIGVKIGAGLKKKVNPVFILFHTIYHFREVHNRFPSPLTRNEDLPELMKIRSIEEQRMGCEKTIVDDHMLEDVFGEISAVCSSVGGIVANEIVKGITKKGLPVCNFYFFDGQECMGVVETIARNIERKA